MKRVFFVASLVLCAALFSAQAVVGYVLTLAGSTTAALPASSSLTVGGLIYDLDAGRVYVNDGTQWLRIPVVLPDGGIN